MGLWSLSPLSLDPLNFLASVARHLVYMAFSKFKNKDRTNDRLTPLPGGRLSQTKMDGLMDGWMGSDANYMPATLVIPTIPP